MDVGIVIGGNFTEVVIRKSSNYNAQVGELLVAPAEEGNILLQITDLLYGSQIAKEHLELIAGVTLEDKQPAYFFDKDLRQYILILAKPLLHVNLAEAYPTKSLPKFFATVRAIQMQDMHFLLNHSASLHFGKLRNGSRTIDVPIKLDARDVLSHHMLVSATTGKGKSTLLGNILFSQVMDVNTAFLVFDPHDEYYGRKGLGLKDHPYASERVLYYSHDPLPGTSTLRIPVSALQPHHLTGVLELTSAQQDALYYFFKQSKESGSNWIDNLFNGEFPKEIHETTVHVLRRKLSRVLQINTSGTKGFGVFSVDSETSMLSDILTGLLAGKTVVVDTSSLSGSTELLVSTVITSYIFDHYRTVKHTPQMPIVSVVLEEAPRVIGKDVLEKGMNVFGTIAREGRKFGMGLVALTQLPSSIPRDILANMNTKIILGTEMGIERQALIDSAAQDLSKDHRSIASLDKGEAIITSNFARFAIPVRIPPLKDTIYAIQNELNTKKYAQAVTGLKQ